MHSWGHKLGPVQCSAPPLPKRRPAMDPSVGLGKWVWPRNPIAYGAVSAAARRRRGQSANGVQALAVAERAHDMFAEVQRAVIAAGAVARRAVARGGGHARPLRAARRREGGEAHAHRRGWRVGRDVSRRGPPARPESANGRGGGDPRVRCIGLNAPDVF